MTKYRIRLKDGRVIGPFLKNQLYELKAKGHIKGNEEAQIFPTGDWMALSRLDFYDDLMNDNKVTFESDSTDGTFIIDLTQIRNKAKEQEIEDLGTGGIKRVELTETVRLHQASPPAKPTKPEQVPNPPSMPDKGPEIKLDDQDVPEAFGFKVEETRLSQDQTRTLINPVAQQELEAMKRKKKAEEDRKIQEEKDRFAEEEAEAKLRALIPQERESKDDSTQMIGLDVVKHDLLEVAEQEEKKIEKQYRSHLKKTKLEEAQEFEDNSNEVDEELEQKKKKKKKIIMTIAGVILLYVILFPEDDKKKSPPFQHLPPQIVFPVPFDKADVTKGKVEFDKGLELFAKGNYPSIVKAGLLFKSSYENDMDNNAALNLLVRSYAEELKHSKNKATDAQTLFNLIQSKRPLLMQDPNGAIGINLFYMSIGKVDAANDVIAKYLKLFPKKVTQDLFAVYLKSLIKGGKVDLAKQFFQALEKAPAKNSYTYEAIIEYLRLNQEDEKADEYLKDAIKNNPKNVSFKLMLAEEQIEDKKFDLAYKNLKMVEDLKLDYNDLNRAKFLELTGLILAAQGNAKQATVFLSKSLQINDSNELRMKLAELSTTNGALAETDKLIAESKAVKYLVQAQDFFEKKSYELALSSAARATDIYPNHIPSELFLAKVQMKLGLAEQALKTMEALIKKYPENKDINFGLVKTYIDTYKFNDAKTRISMIASTDLKGSPEFASLNARLYLKMGDTLQSISWLKASLSLDPLNDQDIFLLAELLIRRANFDQARLLLNKAQELDPVNADYRIAQAKLIYETQDDQAAIGYLLGLLEEFGENPKFLSEIAIFYFRAGKVKDYLAYREKLEKMPNKDKALYEFLIKAALLDERYSEIPYLVEKLLEIEPGDIESMMTAGRVLFENGKLIDAAKWFKRIQDKLSTYPKVQYYIAKIKFLSGDIEGALKDVQKDMKDNGENEHDLVFMGQIYVRKGEFVEAENAFKKAQKLNSKSYEALVGMAELSTKRNNFDQALDLYKRALKQKGDEASIHRKIGDVYRLLGQGTLAIESYKLYLEMNPEASDKAQIDAYINLMQ